MALAQSQEHQHHPEEEEHIHLPDPSIWPLIVALGIPLLPVGTLLLMNADPSQVAFFGASWQSLGLPLIVLGLVVSTIGAFGWAGQVIGEKYTIDISWGSRCLSMAWLLFLVSEAAIFFTFFWHYGYLIYKADGNWPPEGTPHVHLIWPAIGTVILVTSSLTCELGHKAMLAGKRTLCKNWIFLTILLGLAFLFIQGYEWGYLRAYDNFTISSGVLGTLFYMLTGFHGFHVITGLLLLTLVYARLEMGSLDRKRHFSLNAASWYWHFVDVVWIFVFLGVYVGIQVE